ncbi:hypothetical protein Mtc_1530 [Methanocella conradii HZ254]|uniref:Uncharacterized protein n=1 Tax=Methanocella conradii (strain DSM 24694 / JCM 17849 / CGMCC 1.5162 / HZ254) TaxID=1041930 RepID=H8I731_METCZ|nr:hypothetical protein [Methanocella conradii]AFD00282.1 hypothetical protein Mtc_1530 [Methanocella conradii HZ254]MDI6895911.1 hypothetical protein [Methanocella conradii]
MDRTLGILIVSALALALLTATMVSVGHNVMNEDDALRIAENFITNEATYKFDGMKDTLKLDITGTFPGGFEVTGCFISAHGGYGDRTGQFVTEALTPHTCIIIISNGKVESATMDGSYDMISQKLI